jgi:hypothetical protein
MSRPLRLAAIFSSGLITLCAPERFVAQSSTGQVRANEPQVFRGSTTLVPIDVRVLDRSGKAVTDLSLGDFTVTENGVRQEVRLFATQAFAAASPVTPERGDRGGREPIAWTHRTDEYF